MILSARRLIEEWARGRGREVPPAAPLLEPCERCPWALVQGRLWEHLVEVHRVERSVAIAASRRAKV